MKKFKYLIILFLTILFILPFQINAQEKEKINFYLFYGKECPHCEALREWLDIYLKEKNNIKLYEYEVWHNEANQQKFLNVQKMLNSDSSSVPFLVIGQDYIVGFSNLNGPDNVNNIVKKYEKNGYHDVVGKELGIKFEGSKEKVKKADENEAKSFDVLILGKIDARNVSLPILGVILGFIDGFNPCALWVLIFLITMLFGMENRKKMWILGITFLLTSAIVYTLFMVSWLSFALFMGKVSLLKILIGMFAIVFGAYNVLRFIKSLNKDDGCNIVDNTKRKKIINKIKNIVSEKKFIIAIFGVIVLAVSVNLIELMCSLGLPVIYTEVLSLNNLNIVQYSLYIFIYIIFYLIDDLLIFFIAMKTLKIKAISNKYLKYSHLIGGLIMLALGILMIYKPEWLMFNF